jgi:hypothetical protein
MDFLFCWILIANLTTSNYMPPNMEERLHVCTNIISYTPEKEDFTIALAIGWQESSFTDTNGKWICTRKGKLVKTPQGTHRCVANPKSKYASKLTRAIGPMQILPLYHCKKKKSCSTTKKKVKQGVALLYSLIKKHGKTKGIAIYAGGYVNPKSLRYTRRAIALAEKIKTEYLPPKEAFPLPKELLWLWRTIK